MNVRSKAKKLRTWAVQMVLVVAAALVLGGCHYFFPPRTPSPSPSPSPSPTASPTPSPAPSPTPSPTASPVKEEVVTWWDGQVIRFRAYGAGFGIGLNSPWSYAPIKADLQVQTPLYSITVEVWRDRDAYGRGDSPLASVDMRGTSGVWTWGQTILVCTFRN